MKIKEKNWVVDLITSKNVIGITLAPFGIYISSEYIKNQRIIRHETIHWKQQIEMFIIIFYLWYSIEWFIRLFMKGNAYKNISFEREAYDNQCNSNYLSVRKKFAWAKYLKNIK